jgi:large subunit ribosomal protein L3
LHLNFCGCKLVVAYVDGSGSGKVAIWFTTYCVKQGRFPTVSVGILGTKLGMTQVFDDIGRAIPVTVVQAGPCTVTQIKTPQTDGYSAIQIGYEEVSTKALSKPELGHLAKSEAVPLRHLYEYRLSNTSEFELGQQLKADRFEVGQIIDVVGTSIGRGFAGYQKRHNFKRGPMAHGSKNHRLPGSTGAGTTPGRVYPGKRMAGRLGGNRVTVRKLTVVRVDGERNLLLIKGAVPGKPGALLNIVPAKQVGRSK